MRKTEKVTATEKTYGGRTEIEESHPAFGTAIVTRSQGSGRPLFQSDLMHNHTICLSITRATRKRDLARDWVHPTQELIEIEMSLAQWGQLVSSHGIGAGTPVTIRATETDRNVPHIPFEPRLGLNLTEVENGAEKLIAEVREAHARLQDAYDNKLGAKAIREAMHSLSMVIANTPNNATFLVKSLSEAAEHTVTQARSDIEAHILTATSLIEGQAAIEPLLLPDPTAAIEQSRTESE